MRRGQTAALQLGGGGHGQRPALQLPRRAVPWRRWRRRLWNRGRLQRNTEELGQLYALRFQEQHLVANKAQKTLLRLPRILQPQPARRRISRVGKGRQGSEGAGGVRGGEILARHEDLAPDFDHGGQQVRAGRREERVRQAADGKGVMSHVLARGPVAPCGCLTEPSMDVEEPDRESVYLGLDDKGKRKGVGGGQGGGEGGLKRRRGGGGVSVFLGRENFQQKF